MRGARAFVLAIAFTAAAGANGCGARTGLTIPDYDAGPDAPMDAGTDAPDAPLVCMPGEFPILPTSADVVFTIDRSGSMRLTIDGLEDMPPDTWRWAILRDALAGAFATLDPRVRVGAKFYPDPIMIGPTPVPTEVACATSSGIDVPISATGRSRILDVFDTTEALGGTPTALALVEAAAAARASTSTRRFIVLATDGGPNCNGVLTRPCVCTSGPGDCDGIDGEFSCLDDRRTINVIDSTFRLAGIPVFVVGIEDPSRPDLADVMDAMAVAGGRPREGAPRRFYSVRTAAELREALDVITSTISLCGFVSPSVPPDDSTFSIEIDGERVPRDGGEGWAWTDRSRGELEVFGTWCERAQRPGAEIVAIVDDCP